MIKKYNREEAVSYALFWANKRNPKYYNFDELGGDCTNFVSQCLFAGSHTMNFNKNGWFYISPEKRSASWTSAEFLNNFLTRKTKTAGPVATQTSLINLDVGDIVQLKDKAFYHSLIVTKIEKHDGNPFNYKVCAHSFDAYNRRLSTYNLQGADFLKILGFYN